MVATGWTVTRFCCRSGNCTDCGAGFRKGERKRVLHADHLTKARAEEIAQNWREFEPEIQKEQPRTW